MRRDETCKDDTAQSSVPVTDSEKEAERKMTSINSGDEMEGKGRKTSRAQMQESPGTFCLVVAFFNTWFLFENIPNYIY